MTLFRLLTEGSRALEQSGDPDASQDARLLLLAAFHLDMAHFLLNRMETLEENAYNKAATALYRDMLKRRRRRCPLQHILGCQEFMGLEFRVNRHVLIPRQDTETLVELALEESRKERRRSLLDLCTGSGCIAVSMAAKGDFWRVVATDISGEALKVARGNAGRLLEGWTIEGPQKAGEPENGKKKESMGQRPGHAQQHQWEPGYSNQEREKGRQMAFLQGDLFGALQGSRDKFDIITANPPYIPTSVIATLEPEVRDHEPKMALDGSKDGLCYYRRIAAGAGRWMNPGGSLYLEIGNSQGEAVSGLLEKEGFACVQGDRDLAGHDRVVAARKEGV